MKFPGENLVIRLWDSVEKLSIGALKPYQIKRLENLKRKSEIEDLLHQSKMQEITSDLKLIQEQNNLSDSFNNTLNAVITQRQREEGNIISSIAFAHQELINNSMDDEIEDQEEINSDWLHRWYSYASKVSNDELQQLWGKLLAGEVKQVNSISYRLMDFIDKLTSKEIDEIALLLSLVEKSNRCMIRGINSSMAFFNENGIDSNVIQKYTDLGILASSTTGVVNVTTALRFKEFDCFYFTYGTDTFALTLEQDTKEDKKVLYYALGANGQALMDLSDYQSNDDYLKALCVELASANIKMDCK